MLESLSLLFKTAICSGTVVSATADNIEVMPETFSLLLTTFTYVEIMLK